MTTKMMPTLVLLLLACAGSVLALAACAESLASAAFVAGLRVVLSPFLVL